MAEGGGWGDAVLPLVSPKGTKGEWFEDPYGELGYTFSGPGETVTIVNNIGLQRLIPLPGVRIPLIIISPFTRGGNIFTERADHSSMIMFVGT